MERVRRFGVFGLFVAVLAAPGASAQQATPCSQIQESELSEAVAEARRTIAERWLAVGDNFYIAYRMKSPAANPFDLTRPKEKEKGKPNAKDSEEGYIWVGNLQCQLSSTQGDEVVISLIAGAASFVEKKRAWTPPMRQRELTQIVVRKRDTQWIASEQRGDYSILSVDDELRRPTDTEIPPRNKRLGIPCEANQAWNGRRCVTVQR